MLSVLPVFGSNYSVVILIAIEDTLSFSYAIYSSMSCVYVCCHTSYALTGMS